MNSTVLLSICMTGFGVAFFHAAIPTHWLPFVMASRAQKWKKGRTLWVTVLAGAGHVLLTTMLGVLIVWLGIELDKKIGAWFPLIAGGLLLAFGLYYLIQQFRGVGHTHSHLFSHGHHQGHDHHDHHHHEHDHHDHHHSHSHDELMGHALHSAGEKRELEVFESVSGVAIEDLSHSGARVSDRVAILGLLAMLTFSPCEGFLPVYLSGISYGWWGFALLSAILAAGTLLGMVAFTWLTLAGMEKLKLAFLEKYESGLMGVILCLLGFAVVFLER